MTFCKEEWSQIPSWYSTTLFDVTGEGTVQFYWQRETGGVPTKHGFVKGFHLLRD